ncbi:hypothetical protein AB4254_10900 [Vibrio breoganii]
MSEMRQFIGAEFGDAKNGITITSSDGSDPSQFRFHMTYYQGNDTGIDAYINVLGIRDAITNTIKFLKSNHKDFLIESMTQYMEGQDITKPSPVALFSEHDEDELNFYHEEVAFNRAVGDLADSVKVSHSSRTEFIKVVGEDGNTTREMRPGTRSIDNVTLRFQKWQGENENGTEGLVRLLALQNAIERCACALNLTFGMHKDAENIIRAASTKEKSEQTMSL